MRMPAFIALGLLGGLLILPPRPAETRIIFDTELRFNPLERVRLHYAQSSILQGTEIQFAEYREVFGQITSIFDEVILANSGGVIDVRVEFQTYDPMTRQIFDVPPDPNNPFAGGGGRPGGFDEPGDGEGGSGFGIQPPPALRPLPAPSQPAMVQSPTGRQTLDIEAARDRIQQSWRASGQTARFGNSIIGGGQPPVWGGMMMPSPMQRSGGGGDGGGGDGGGGGGGPTPGQPSPEEEDFQVSPILETQLEYSIAQNGRLLNLSGLDIIGDIINPRRNVTVRQFWQSSHFLTLPDGPIHVNESWKGPWFWNVPYVGKTVEIPLTYTLEGITTMERFRVAVISFSGIKQFEMTTLDENFERRIESNIDGDISCQGFILFDIDRGVVVALGRGLNNKRRLVQQGGFPQPDGFGMAAWMTFDRIDTWTPLGNVVDTRPIDTHKLQELTWVTWLVME